MLRVPGSKVRYFERKYSRYFMNSQYFGLLCSAGYYRSCGTSRYCSLCQTIWTRGLATRDSSSITGSCSISPFLRACIITEWSTIDRETDSAGTSILIPLVLLNFNMRLYGNPTAWYLLCIPVIPGKMYLAYVFGSARTLQNTLDTTMLVTAKTRGIDVGHYKETWRPHKVGDVRGQPTK